MLQEGLGAVGQIEGEWQYISEDFFAGFLEKTNKPKNQKPAWTVS